MALFLAGLLDRDHIAAPDFRPAGPPPGAEQAGWLYAAVRTNRLRGAGRSQPVGQDRRAVCDAGHERVSCRYNS